MKRVYIFAGLVIFGLGWYLGYETTEDYRLPNYITIRRDGKALAYAKTKPSDGKIVMLPNIENPGAYLAFPIYSDEDNFERLLS